MLENFSRRESFRRFTTHHRANETLRFGRNCVWYCEMATPNLGEKNTGLSIVKRISTHKHRVQHDTQTPNVRGFAGVSTAGLQDLRAYVSGAAVFVFKRIIWTVEKESVFQAFEFHIGSES